MVEKLGLPFPLLSDPRGALIKRPGLWNEEDGVSEPAVVVLDRSGTARHLYSGGKDFYDRPYQESLLGTLDQVRAGGEPGGCEPEVRASAQEAEDETVRPDRPAMTLEQLALYYRGTLLRDGRDEEEARRGDMIPQGEGPYKKVVNEYNAAIQETGKQKSGS